MTDNRSTPNPDGIRARADADDREPTTMREVSHTPPEGDGANRVWDGTRVYARDDEPREVRGRDETSDDE